MLFCLKRSSPFPVDKVTLFLIQKLLIIFSLTDRKSPVNDGKDKITSKSQSNNVLSIYRQDLGVGEGYRDLLGVSSPPFKYIPFILLGKCDNSNISQYFNFN